MIGYKNLINTRKILLLLHISIIFFYTNSNIYGDNEVDITYNYDDYEYDQDNEYDCDKIYDPFESVNRKILDFNMMLDRLLVRKLSHTYKANAPTKVQVAFSNFFYNLYMPNTIVNSFLQGDTKNGLRAVWQVFINSTFGLFGFNDVAARIGIVATKTTFGDTLAKYGFYRGPYLMFPIFGPTTVSNSTEIIINILDLFNPILYNIPKALNLTVKASNLTVNRSKNTNLLTDLDDQSTDLYSTIRSVYWQYLKANSKYPVKNKCKSKI